MDWDKLEICFEDTEMFSIDYLLQISALFVGFQAQSYSNMTIKVT